MLALQRPSMGSTQSPNLELPLSYVDDAGNSYLYSSPTAPTQGPFLLNDNESRILHSFFDGVAADQSSSVLGLYLLNNEQNLNVEWENPPQTNIEVPTSEGPSSQVVAYNGLPDVNFGQMSTSVQLNTNPNLTPPASLDPEQVTAFLQNSSRNYPGLGDDFSLLESQEAQFITVAGPDERTQLIPQSFTELQPLFQPQENTADFTGEPTHTDLVFRDHPAEIQLDRRVDQRDDIRWGSDLTFTTPQDFRTSSGRENVPKSDNIPETENNPDTENDPDDENTLDTERYCFRTAETLSNKTMASKRKNSTRDLDDSQTVEFEPIHKRRRSTVACVTKTTRENLTEEQKRENHIKSEQKRRTMIREGFEDLNDLVPGLRGGGFSKSAILFQTADWLGQLIAENGILRSKIDMIKGNK